MMKTHSCQEQPNLPDYFIDISIESNIKKIFEGELFFKTLSTHSSSLWELMLHSEVIFKIMTCLDDACQVDLKAGWD